MIEMCFKVITYHSLAVLRCATGLLNQNFMEQYCVLGLYF